MYDVSFTMQDDQTPLHLACQRSSDICNELKGNEAQTRVLEIAHLLIERGADVHSKDKVKKQPRDEESVAQLMKAGWLVG